jgi:AcrR family transcriptional regulator
LWLAEDPSADVSPEHRRAYGELPGCTLDSRPRRVDHRFFGEPSVCGARIEQGVSSLVSTTLSGPTTTAVEGAVTRERILDVAEALFADRGLAGTGVREIARSAGLTPASLYNHFASKQALYEAVIERGVRPLLELFERLPAREHTAEAFDDTINAVMAHLASHPHLARLIHHETISGGESLKGLVEHWIRPLLEQAQREMQGDISDYWSEDEAPLMITGWFHLVIGHFAMAPMLEEIFGEDPLSPRNLERQTRFLRKLSRLMMQDPRSGDG